MSFIRTRLSVMMFLEFFIWGAWYPLVFGYLPAIGFTDTQQTLTLACFNVAAVVAMFFSTQFADRTFAAEKFLAFSMLVGGVAMMALAFTRSFPAFFGLMLVHCLLYVPTISITNSIAFANVKDPQRDFGLVRLWGTIGWIAASWPFVLILVDWKLVPSFGSVPFVDWLGAVLRTSKTGGELVQATSYTFLAAGIASLVLGGFALALPHTPPKPAAKGDSQFAWLDAARLLQVGFMLVLFIVTFFDATVHQFYFFWTGRYLTSIGIPGNWVMPAMSVGQFAEIGTMAILAIFLKSLGWRWTMTIGIMGHAVRFAVFALFPYPAVAVAANLLHGICYAFFFATVYIFVDEFFPKDVRSSAQGLFNLLILGIGPLLGNYLGPRIGEMVSLVDVRTEVQQVSGGDEVVVKGTINTKSTPDFGSLTLTIQEPGGEPYQRPVTLDANRQFELVLGAPKQGNYSGTVPWRRDNWFAPDRDVQTTLPDLTVGELDPKNLPRVRATDVDYQRLFLFPSVTALAAAILLLIGFHPPARAGTSEGAAVAAPH
jgi:nucleoside transporter